MSTNGEHYDLGEWHLSRNKHHPRESLSPKAEYLSLLSNTLKGTLSLNRLGHEAKYQNEKEYRYRLGFPTDRFMRFSKGAFVRHNLNEPFYKKVPVDDTAFKFFQSLYLTPRSDAEDYTLFLLQTVGDNKHFMFHKTLQYMRWANETKQRTFFLPHPRQHIGSQRDPTCLIEAAKKHGVYTEYTKFLNNTSLVNVIQGASRVVSISSTGCFLGILFGKPTYVFAPVLLLSNILKPSTSFASLLDSKTLKEETLYQWLTWLKERVLFDFHDPSFSEKLQQRIKLYEEGQTDSKVLAW